MPRIPPEILACDYCGYHNVTRGICWLAADLPSLALPRDGSRHGASLHLLWQLRHARLRDLRPARPRCNRCGSILSPGGHCGQCRPRPQSSISRFFGPSSTNTTGSTFLIQPNEPEPPEEDRE